MNNVAAGNFVDEETGESLNDVETVLNELGIKLRDVSGEFRNSGEVLDEVAGRWESFDSVSQHAIATAFAGTRQQEKFIVLMENYGSALKYAETATNSAGTALEKYGAHTDSIEGKMASLTASFEKFSMQVLDSEVVKFFVDFANVAVSFLSIGDALVVKFALIAVACVAAIALLNKALVGLGLNAGLAKTSFGDLVAAIQLGSASIGQALLTLAKNPVVYLTLLITTFVAFSDKMNGASSAIVGAVLAIGAGAVLACQMANGAVWGFMSSNPLGWILLLITGIVLGVTQLIKGIQKLMNAEEEQRNAALDSAKALQEEADALREVADAAQDASNEITTLIEDFEELDEQASNAEWYEYLKTLGESIGELFDEELTPLGAINKLLGTTYTYDELINQSQSERLELLKQIEAESLKISKSKYDEAYTSQKNATTAMTEALGMKKTLKKKSVNANDEKYWGDVDNDTIQGMINEAETFIGALDGITIAAGNKTAQITVDAEDSLDYVEKLRNVVETYKEMYGDNTEELKNNGVYQFFVQSLSEAETSLKSQLETLYQNLQTTTDIAGLSLDINLDSTDLQAEYNTAIETIANAVKSDSVISQAITDGLLDDGKIVEFATGYIAENYSELYNAVNKSVRGIRVELKSMVDMLDEAESQFDLLTTAMDEMSASGALSAETIRKITDEFPELKKYIAETADGFILLESALPDFLTDVRDSYTNDILQAQAYFEQLYAAYESSDVKTTDAYNEVIEAQEQLENAIANAENWMRVEAVLTRESLMEQYTDILDKRKDALDEQIDAYSELCDIRKDLLKTYQEELSYTRELQKKQSKVTRLQTSLSVARLDDSAAGQARVRDLEEQLQEAQDELDEFTLEHAVDVLTAQIEASDKQFEHWIETQIDEIEQAISNATGLTTAALESAIKNLGERPVSVTVNTTTEESKTNAGNAITSGTESSTKPVTEANTVPTPKEDTTPTPAPKNPTTTASKYAQTGLNIGYTTYTESEYNSKIKKDSSGNTYLPYTAYGKSGEWVKLGEGYTYKKKDGKYEIDWHSFKSTYKLTTSYHTGGLVGDIATLSSSEEFAKLLKGEFVSTPAQMKRFMEDTLPKIANYSAAGGSNEFNAPLIEITCESVTTEALPELERVVNEAVKEIQKQLDSGMSRTGFKRTPTKRLT